MTLLDETPDVCGAFPRLSAEHIALLDKYGEHRQVEPGDVLIREGVRDRDFYVILAGQVVVVEGHGTPDERVIRAHGAGRFLDEISLLTRQPALVSSVVRDAGEVLAVPLPALREAVSQDSKLGDVILRAFMIRRELLIGVVSGIRIIGSRFSPDTRRLREFAARNRLPYTWIDLEDDADAEALLQQFGVHPDETPVVVTRDNQVLRNPSNTELARAIGVPVPSAPDRVADLVVVGAGPAGLAAAVYGASEGLSTVVLDAVASGGQAATSSRIENYLGFPAGISGAELADRAVIQAEKFGATISVPVGATGLDAADGVHLVRLDDGTRIQTRAVVIATGARYRKLNVPRLAEFEGTSVYYAATLMEAQFCAHQHVSVVGGGNSAGQATVYLARHARSVRLLIRHDDLGRDMSRYLVDQIERIPNVEVLRHTEVRELVGHDGELEALVVEDNHTRERRELPATLLFVFIGAEPCTGWLGGSVALDDHGYVHTGVSNNLLETSCPGVLAVGDVRSGSIKRVASAVGDGAMAVRLVHEYLARSGRVPGR
jgi:thioredoxin reductase (NADPH)